MYPCGCGGGHCCPEENRLHLATRASWRATEAATNAWKAANPGVPIGIWYATAEFIALEGIEDDCSREYYAHLPKQQEAV